MGDSIKLKDLAKYLGVSEATVSLAINDRSGVSKETKQKVLKAAKKLNYRPNSIAKTLATKSSNNIGVIVTNIDNPFFGYMVDYLSKDLRKFGYELILSITNDDILLEDTIIDNFIYKQVDGMIIVPSENVRNDFSIFEKLEYLNIPYVFNATYYKDNNFMSSNYNWNCIMTDLKKGSYDLAEYLISLNLTNILFLVSENSNKIVSSFERIEGYKKALNKNNIKYNSNNILECKKISFDSAYNKIYSYLMDNKKEEVDAIIAINDIMALGAMRALKNQEIKVPKEIAVAGYDDVIFSATSEIPLTTVKQNIKRISSESVKLLMKKIKSPKSNFNKFKLIDPELIIRKST